MIHQRTIHQRTIHQRTIRRRTIRRRTIRLAALALGGLCAAAAPALAEGPVLVTVTGAVGNANRGAMDPDVDKLFAFNGVEFEAAHEFDLGALQALPQATVATDFPLGGETVAFAGPTLADLLAAAEAQGETVTVQALDGYAVDAPLAEMLEKGAVLALERDGRPLGIGSFGPAQIVFPRGERDDLAEMVDDWWVWQIFHIRVE